MAHANGWAMSELNDRLLNEIVEAVKDLVKKEQSDRLRDVYLVGDIEKDTARQAIERLRDLANDSRKPITVYINSAGGNVTDGLAIHDTVRYLVSLGYEITIVVQGMAYSMGSVVLQAASPGKRFAFPHSWIMPALRLQLRGRRAALTLDEVGPASVQYPMEKLRGYESVGALWSPGYFRVDLDGSQPVTLIASTEPWESIEALSPEDAAGAEVERRLQLLSVANLPAHRLANELVLAADQFVITPSGRAEETARARAAGEHVPVGQGRVRIATLLTPAWFRGDDDHHCRRGGRVWPGARDAREKPRTALRLFDDSDPDDVGAWRQHAGTGIVFRIGARRVVAIGWTPRSTPPAAMLAGTFERARTPRDVPRTNSEHACG